MTRLVPRARGILVSLSETTGRPRPLTVGTVLKEGAFAIGRGSLAEVLPEPFRLLFVRAGREAGDSVEWTARPGALYKFRICRPR